MSFWLQCLQHLVLGLYSSPSWSPWLRLSRRIQWKLRRPSSDGSYFRSPIKLCERCHADELKHDVDSHNVELPQRRQILAGGGSLAATGLQMSRDGNRGQSQIVSHNLGKRRTAPPHARDTPSLCAFIGWRAGEPTHTHSHSFNCRSRCPDVLPF